MKYWQKVRVTSWFYEGMEAVIIAQWIWNFDWIRYAIADNFWPVKYLNPNQELELQTFELSDLEIIN